jgi:hypothetical protein
MYAPAAARVLFDELPFFDAKVWQCFTWVFFKRFEWNLTNGECFLSMGESTHAVLSRVPPKPTSHPPTSAGNAELSEASISVVWPPFSWENTIPLTLTCRVTTASEASILDRAMEDISPFPTMDDVPSHENIAPITNTAILWNSWPLVTCAFYLPY